MCTILRRTVISFLALCSFACLPALAADIVWISSAGGYWTNAANWSPAQVPTAADNAWITNNGTYTVTLSTSGTAARVNLGGASGTQTLLLSGTLTGATLSRSAGGVLLPSSGTLSGATLEGNFTIPNSTTLKIANGLTLSGGATLTISPAGNNTFLLFNPGTQTLGGTGEILLADVNYGYLRLGNGGATALTIGPNVVVRGRGWLDQSSGSSLVNQGRIQADVPGQTLTVTMNAFTNSGVLRATNSSTLTVTSTGTTGLGGAVGTLDLASGSTLSLNGSTYSLPTAGVTVPSGATLTLNGNWSNPGTLSLNGGTLNLDGTFTQASMGTFVRSGGVVNLIGTINSGLALDGATGSWSLGSGGNVNGGNVSLSGGASLTVAGGTLTGVTLLSSLVVPNNNSLYIANGLTLAGGASITVSATGNATFLQFKPGTQSLSGTGQIILANASTAYLRIGSGGLTTLTIGPNILVRGRGYIDQSSGSTLINQGTIQADASAQLLSITMNSFTNSGALRAINGATLNVGGLGGAVHSLEILDTGTDVTLNGTSYSLPVSGVTVPTGASLTLNGGWTNPGVLTLAGGALNLGGTFTQAALGTFNRMGGTVNVTGAMSGGLALDAATGSWSLSGTLNGGTVSATGGAQLIGAGGTLSGVTLASDVTVPNNTSLFIANGLTLSGTTLTISPTGNATFLQFKSGIQTLGGTGQVILGNASTAYFRIGSGGATTLTIGPNITIRGRGYIDQSSGSTLINRGIIQADVNAQTLSLSQNSFSNAGALRAINGATFSVSGLSGSMPGTVEITDTGTDVTFNGSNYELPASLSLPLGTSLTLNGTWNNSGVLNLNGAVLNLGGTFTQTNLGTFVRTGGTVNLTGTLNGDLSLDAVKGSWTMAASATINSGAISTTGSAQLALAGGTLNGVTLASDLVIPNNVVVNVGNGLTLAGGTTLALNPTGNNTFLQFKPGTQSLSGNGQIVFANANNSYLRIGAGGASTVTIGPGITIRGRGFIDQSSASTLLNQGTIQSEASGQTLKITVANFSNSGVLKAVAGTLSIASPFTQTGGATVLAGGVVTCSTVFDMQGGLLTGIGTLTGYVINGGTVSPGASPGLLTIASNYTQTASGRLNIELAGTAPGTSFDRVAITGTAALAGTVNLTLTNGFYPAANASFAFLTAATRSGTFSTLNYPSNDVGMTLLYNATSASAQVINVRPVLPVIPAQMVNELVALNVNAAATDEDVPVQTLTYGLADAPAGMSINPATGLITWTPTEADGPMTTNATVLVTDSGTPNLTVSKTFAVTVNEINVAPVLTLPPSQNVAEQTAFSAMATATDSDIPANALTFELISGPPGLTISPQGAIRWTPTEAQGSASYPVAIRLSDTNVLAVNETSLSTTNSFTLTVQEVNQPPVLTVPADQVITEETPLSVTVSATDPDLPTNTLVFALISPPPGMTIDSATGLISWTPTEAQGSNSYTVRVSVTDENLAAINNQHLSVTNSFKVTVNEFNRPPVLILPLDRTVHAGCSLNLTAAATDPDIPANTLTFSLVSGPSALTVQDSGAIAWTPSESQLGSHVVTVAVQDNGTPRLGATNHFAITVVSRPVLQCPSISGTNLLLTWSAIANTSYRVETKEAISASWAALPGDVTAAASTASKLDPLPNHTRFYRVRVLP